MRNDPGRFRDKEIETIRVCKVNELISRVMWPGSVLRKLMLKSPRRKHNLFLKPIFRGLSFGFIIKSFDLCLGICSQEYYMVFGIVIQPSFK